MFSIELNPLNTRMRALTSARLSARPASTSSPSATTRPTAIGSLNKRKRCLFIPSPVFLMGWVLFFRHSLSIGRIRHSLGVPTQSSVDLSVVDAGGENLQALRRGLAPGWAPLCTQACRSRRFQWSLQPSCVSGIVPVWFSLGCVGSSSRQQHVSALVEETV